MPFLPTRRMRALVSVLLLLGSMAGVHLIAQGGPVHRSEACPDVKNYAVFHRCAVEKMRAFTPPRAPDGHPDLRGLWQPTGVAYDIEEYTATQYGPAGAPANPGGAKSLIVDPPDGMIPYQPWATEVRRFARHAYISPISACFQVGPQRFFLLGPVMVVQQPGLMLFVTERYNGHRLVPLRQPPPGQTFALWNGASRGRWEGNTLVIETRNLNGLTWFDQMGNFLSAEASLVERITFVDANTLHYEETITDPKVYTRPWTIAQAMQRSALKDEDAEIWYEDHTENCHVSLQNQFNQGKRWWPGIAVLAPWTLLDIQEPK